MTVGSLFAGIGGFDLGFERAGFEITWQVEIDPFCRAVLAQHWPDVRRYEDVRTVGAELGYVDVLCGGFPCQDISVAGRGDGIDGARSGLWSEYARLIRELRPRYVVVENVAALLTRGLGRVLGDLAACGYDAEWDCLPASAFGAPHRRDRLWLVAYPQRDELRDQPGRRGGPRGVSASVPRHNGAAEHVADADDRRELQPQGRIFDERRRFGDGGWWRIEPHVGRVAHGIPARVDRLRGLGNAIVPQIAEWIARQILHAEGD